MAYGQGRKGEPVSSLAGDHQTVLHPLISILRRPGSRYRELISLSGRHRKGGQRRLRGDGRRAGGYGHLSDRRGHGAGEAGYDDVEIPGIGQQQ